MVTSGKKKKKSSTLQGFHMFSDMQCSLRLKQTLNSFHLWCGLLRQRIQQWASAKSTSLRASEKGSLRLIPCAIERSSIAVFWDVNSILLCGCELSQRTRYTTEKMQAIYIISYFMIFVTWCTTKRVCLHFSDHQCSNQSKCITSTFPALQVTQPVFFVCLFMWNQSNEQKIQSINFTLIWIMRVVQ